MEYILGGELSLKYKIISATGILFTFFLLTASWFEFIEVKSISQTRILQEARNVKGLMMATRFVYHHQFIDSELPLNDKTLGFLPAHALSKISVNFNQQHQDQITFNNVSTAPRNDNNQANKTEQQAIDFFKESPQQTEYFQLVETPDSSYYQYASPLWVKEYCLQCHGDRQQAPLTIQQRYLTGFNYTLGDLRGIISVRIPVKQSYEFIIDQLQINLPIIAVSLISLFVLMYWLLQTSIIHRLQLLLTTANNIRHGHYDQKNAIKGNDEIARLAKDIDRMSQAIASRESGLKKSQQRLANAQRIAHLGNWDWDAQTRTLFCSDETYRILGWNPAETYPSYRAFLSCLNPTQRKKLRQHLKQSIHDRFFSDLELRVNNNQHEPCYIRVRGEIEIDQQSHLLFSGTIQDITAVKLTEQKINALNLGLEKKVQERTEALALANKELESFSYSVSHDLRSPLRAISGFSQILLDDHSSELSKEAQRYLQLVAGNSTTMGILIDDLLNFSRLNRHSLNKQQVEMRPQIDHVIRELFDDPQQLKQPNVEIIIDQLPPCYADPALLKQVLTNLISNALKFSHKQAAPRIEISSQPSTKGPVYFIRDNGAGFDMQYAKKLFSVFQRLHHQDEFSGTGVGLATVQRIISRHGGQIWAESAPDQGATFYFTFEGAHE